MNLGFFQNVCSLLVLTVFSLFGIRFVHFSGWIKPECLWCVCVCVCWNASVWPVVIFFFSLLLEAAAFRLFDVPCWWSCNRSKLLRLEKVEHCHEWKRAAAVSFYFICIVCNVTILVYKGFSCLNSLNCSLGQNEYCILQSVELFLKTNVCYKCKCIFFQILYTIVHELSLCLHHHAQKEYI